MNNRMLYILFLFTLFMSTIQAKVSIFAHYFGQPEFIRYQYLFFKKNLLDKHELVVFDDSNNTSTSEQIKNECNKYGVKYIRIPRSVFESPKLTAYVGKSTPSFQCSVAIQYIYDNYVIPSSDICLLLDNDIFLLSEFSIEKYLGSSAFSYVEQKRGAVDYMLPNFLILNPNLMHKKDQLDFNLGLVEGNNTDSGGYTHYYLRDYRDLGKKISIYYLYNTISPFKDKYSKQCSLLFNSDTWLSHYFIDKETFLHIRMGSNWSSNSNYAKMIQEVNFFFEDLIKKDALT